MNNTSNCSAKPVLWSKNFVLTTISSLLMFTAFYMLMPIIAKYVVEEFHASPSVAGVVVSVYIISALLARPFSGYLVDRFDRKKLYVISYIAFMLLCYSYSFAVTIPLLILLRVLLGATFSVVTNGGSTYAIDMMPSERRGEGIGYFGAITVLAMAIGPMAGLYLLDLFSYTELFLTAGTSCFLGLILLLFTKATHRQRVEHKKISIDRFVLKSALSIAAVMAIVNFPFGIMMAYMPLYLSEMGINIASANFFLYFAAGVIISRFSVGKLLDRGMHNKILTAGISGLALGLAVFTFMLTPAIFPYCSFFIGLSAGLISPTVQSMIVNLATHAQRGTANSTFFIALDLGSGMGMLVGGIFAAATSFNALFALSIAMTIIGVVIYKIWMYPIYQKNLKRFLTS